MSARRLFAACALLLIAASTASAQQSETSFVAEPVPGSQTAPTGGYFLLQAAPGEEIRQSVGLRNDSGAELELRLDAVDATTGQRGGASYGLPGDPLRRTGGWIDLEQSTVTLGAGESATVSFRVAVPADAESGQHLAGLSIAAPGRQDDGAEAGEGQAGASIDVQTRRIIAVQVDLPGPAEPELVIAGVTPAARPDGLYLEVAIENQGNALTKAEGVLTVDDDFEREFPVDTFVPGTAIAYPIKWTDAAEDGEHEATVELRYDGDIARWSGTFRAGEEVLDELAERQVAPPAAGDDDSDIPLAVIAVAALAGAAVFGVGAYGLSRLRRPRGKHSTKRRPPPKRALGN